MQIFVKGEATVVLEVSPSASVSHVKSLIEANGKGVSTEDHHLMFSGKCMDDVALLSDYDIVNQSTIHLVPNLPGGAKKRKKKNYTTPKKNKHKKKNIKLATLKYYKVDDNGKITRLRRECPTCGAGVFMASHFDRHTCGKCSLTFVYNKPEEEEVEEEEDDE